MTDDTQEFETVDVEGAAKLLCVHTETVKEMARDGVIPGAKVGRAWVFMKDQLLNWLSAEIEKQHHKRVSQNINNNGVGEMHLIQIGNMKSTRLPVKILEE